MFAKNFPLEPARLNADLRSQDPATNPNSCTSLSEMRSKQSFHNRWPKTSMFDPRKRRRFSVLLLAVFQTGPRPRCASKICMCIPKFLECRGPFPYGVCLGNKKHGRRKEKKVGRGEIYLTSVREKTCKVIKKIRQIKYVVQQNAC